MLLTIDLMQQSLEGHDVAVLDDNLLAKFPQLTTPGQTQNPAKSEVFAAYRQWDRASQRKQAWAPEEFWRTQSECMALHQLKNKDSVMHCKPGLTQHPKWNSKCKSTLRWGQWSLWWWSQRMMMIMTMIVSPEMQVLPNRVTAQVYIQYENTRESRWGWRWRRWLTMTRMMRMVASPALLMTTTPMRRRERAQIDVDSAGNGDAHHHDSEATRLPLQGVGGFRLPTSGPDPL